MKKRYIWILISAIFVLLVPSIIYLCFLIPKMQDEYIILMSSGGVIAGGGFYGASAIPEKVKYSGLFKTSAKAFTLLTVVTLVEKFIVQIIGLVATIVVSYVIFKILLEVYRARREEFRSKELAREIAQSVNDVTK